MLEEDRLSGIGTASRTGRDLYQRIHCIHHEDITVVVVFPYQEGLSIVGIYSKGITSSRTRGEVNRTIHMEIAGDVHIATVKETGRSAITYQQVTGVDLDDLGAVRTGDGEISVFVHIHYGQAPVHYLKPTVPCGYVYYQVRIITWGDAYVLPRRAGDVCTGAVEDETGLQSGGPLDGEVRLHHIVYITAQELEGIQAV